MPSMIDLLRRLQKTSAAQEEAKKEIEVNPQFTVANNQVSKNVNPFRSVFLTPLSPQVYVPQAPVLANPPSVVPQRPPPPAIENIKQELEVITGLDTKKIDLNLATATGPLEAPNGFLIEVYLSGADGKLTRVYRESVVDLLSDQTLSDGFSDYLTLEVDQ